jgi:hypothetical protein
MSRNVVTLMPRVLVLPTRGNRRARERIDRSVTETFRARRESGPDRIEIDFPPGASRRTARGAVTAELDRVESRWRRLYVLYPTESSLREGGE